MNEIGWKVGNCLVCCADKCSAHVRVFACINYRSNVNIDRFMATLATLCIKLVAGNTTETKVIKKSGYR